MKLSVLVPGIRTKNWITLYNSISESFSQDWEIIFVGPCPPPNDLSEFNNVKYINSFSSPIVCQQLGLIAASGEYITWAADDGVFCPGALDIAFKKVQDKDYKTLVMGKYIEGQNNGDMTMQNNSYYNLKNHNDSRLKELPGSTIWMLNVGIVSRQLLLEVGGWDCQFEVCPMAYNDLAIRLQNYKCNFLIQDEIMFTCSHLPGHEGDHGPIHDGQVIHDQPLFKKIYDLPYAEKRIFIKLDNWNECPKIWSRRFKNEKISA